MHVRQPGEHDERALTPAGRSPSSPPGCNRARVSCAVRRGRHAPTSATEGDSSGSGDARVEVNGSLRVWIQYGPHGLAFDAAGNAHDVASIAPDTVSKVTPAGVVSRRSPQEFTSPNRLAFDAADNLLRRQPAIAGTLSAVSTGPVSVPFTLGGTATAGLDYSGVAAGPLVPRGQTDDREDDHRHAAAPTPAPARHSHSPWARPPTRALGSPTVNTLTIDEPNPDSDANKHQPRLRPPLGPTPSPSILTGTNFIAGSTVEFNGTPLENLLRQCDPADRRHPGVRPNRGRLRDPTASTTPAGRGGPNPLTFTVNNPAPPPPPPPPPPTPPPTPPSQQSQTLVGGAWRSGRPAMANGQFGRRPHPSTPRPPSHWRRRSLCQHRLRRRERVVIVLARPAS